MTGKQIRRLYMKEYHRRITEWDKQHPKEAAAGKPWPKRLWNSCVANVDAKILPHQEAAV